MGDAINWYRLYSIMPIASLLLVKHEIGRSLSGPPPPLYRTALFFWPMVAEGDVLWDIHDLTLLLSRGLPGTPERKLVRNER